MKPIHAESIAWTWRAPKEAKRCYGNTVAQRSLVGAGQTFELSSNSTTSSVLKALKLGCETWKFLEEMFVHESIWSIFFIFDDSNSTNLTLIYAFKDKSDLRKSTAKKNPKQHKTTHLGLRIACNVTIQLTSDTTIPWLHLSLAGDDLAMIPVSWKPPEQEIERNPWRVRTMETFHWILRASWMSCFFPFITADYLSPYTVSSFKCIFYWSSTGFDCHAWIWTTARSCQLKDSPCEGGANHITNTQSTKNQGILFQYSRRHGRCCANMPFPTRYFWLENKNSVWSAKLRCAPGSRSYWICHLNVVATHSKNKRKQLSICLVSGVESGLMLAFWLHWDKTTRPTRV